MAKVALTTLRLAKDNSIKTIEYNEKTIEVKQYLPIEDKMELIATIVNNSADDNNYYNPCRLEIYTITEMILAYTNISVTDKQKEDIYKLYDVFVSSDLGIEILNTIPEEERQFVLGSVEALTESIYKYKNSAMGIFESIATDYSNLEMDTEKLHKNLADPNNLTLLKDIMTKLG